MAVEKHLERTRKQKHLVVLSVFVDPQLKQSRGYDLVLNMLRQEAERREIALEIVDTLEELDQDKRYGTKRIPLILAFDGETYAADRNVYYFDTDFRKFIHDLFLLPLFFDALMAKGLNIKTFECLKNIGNVRFHQDIAAHINSAILEKIEERIVQVAA